MGVDGDKRRSPSSSRASSSGSASSSAAGQSESCCFGLLYLRTAACFIAIAEVLIVAYQASVRFGVSELGIRCL